jgi:hypothetical protein
MTGLTTYAGTMSSASGKYSTPASQVRVEDMIVVSVARFVKTQSMASSSTTSTTIILVLYSRCLSSDRLI